MRGMTSDAFLGIVIQIHCVRILYCRLHNRPFSRFSHLFIHSPMHSDFSSSPFAMSITLICASSLGKSCEFSTSDFQIDADLTYLYLVL